MSEESECDCCDIFKCVTPDDAFEGPMPNWHLCGFLDSNYRGNPWNVEYIPKTRAIDRCFDRIVQNSKNRG